jgi:hypothetical protein
LTNSFYDLRQIADKNGYDNFTNLEEILSKSETSEAPVFEAFGIKFPADIATLGGTLALLGVQLYFFLYLRKLYGSLKQHDPGWDVPWIGMDSSGLAQSAYMATIVILPVVSETILSLKTAARLSMGYRKFLEFPIHLLGQDRAIASSQTC